MFVLKKISIILLPIVWFVCFELVKSNFLNWWQYLGVIFVYQIFVLLFLHKFKLNNTFFHFLIVPIVFSVGCFFALTLTVNDYFFHVLVIASCLLQYALFRQYYLYLYFQQKYQPYSLESLYLYMLIFASFFIFSGAFGSIVLLQLNLWLVLLIQMILIMPLLYVFFWINKVEISKSWLFIFVIGFLTLQLFMVVSYLPSGFYLNAFLLTVAIYIMIGLSKKFLKNELNKKVVISYLIVGGISLITALITARWE